MNESRRSDLMILAVALAGVLDFAANYLAAHYLVSMGTFLIPGGTFVFAFAFTVYDYLRRFHGLTPTIAAILLGFVSSVLWADAFGGGMGRIAVAGLLALACSSSLDLVMQTITLRWPIWLYVGTSNLVSLALDTAVFTLIAFALLPWSVRVHIMEGQYLAKIAVMALSIPLVYLARHWACRAHGQMAEAAA